jgi:ADP-heptose:LPS heptosyltransferase
MSDTRTIAYFKNGIGNFVQMTPALQALASMEESGRIDLCIDSCWEDMRSGAFADIFAGCQFIDKVIRFPAEKFPREYKRWFYSKHSEGSDAFTLFQAKAPLFGNKTDWVASLTNEVDYYMNLVRAVGYRGPTPRQYFPVMGAEQTQRVLTGTRPHVGLCNGSFGKMAIAKQWPHFARLAEALRLMYDVRIVTVGVGKELSDVQADSALVGKLSITETAAVIQQLKLLITVDSGLMHVADALGVPTLVIFGGSLVSKNGPVNPETPVVRLGLPCQPCQYTGLFDQCTNPICLKELTVGAVLHHVRAFLS